MMLCQIELSNYCNFQCAGCLRSSMKRAQGLMNSKVFEKSLKLCGDLGVQETWLHNWGEPLLHPSLLGFVTLASQQFRVGFATNGSLLAYPVLKLLKEAGLTNLDISINGSTRKEFIPYLLKMYKRANAMGINCWIRTVIFSSEQYIYLKKILKKRKIRWQRGMIQNKSYWRTEDCPAIDKIFVIYWNGDVVPCCQVVDNEIIYGSVFSPNIKEKVKSGIKAIHTSIKDGSGPQICTHCFEVDCEMPVSYKLRTS